MAVRTQLTGFDSFDKWPAVGQQSGDPISSEEQLVIEMQSKLIAETTGPQRIDEEIVKTIEVFQKNLDAHQQLLDTLIDERKQYVVQLAQAEGRVTEAQKTHAEYVKTAEQLINELRAQNADLAKRVQTLESKVWSLEQYKSWWENTWNWFCGQYTNLCNTLNSHGVYP